MAVFAETEWCSMDAYNKVIGVNLLGTIRVTKACLPLIRKAQGRVVSISSLAGTVYIYTLISVNFVPDYELL